MNWVFVSLLFLTSAILWLAWMGIRLASSLRDLWHLQNSDMKMVHEMFGKLLEHQANIVMSSKDSFIQMSESQLKLTKLVETLAKTSQWTDEPEHEN